MGQEKYVGTTRISGKRPKWTGTVKFDNAALEIPQRWKKGRLIFVNSMSDLFHDAVPLDFVHRVVDVMRKTPQHTYQVLTKRAERLAQAELAWPDNAWVGVSVENDDYWHRVDHLRRVDARIKFLSIEPLLGRLTKMDFKGIDWVIVGGESGPAARSINPDWVREIRDACLRQKVPFHFKQWGGRNKRASGRTLDKRTWDQMPSRVQRQSNEAMSFS
jgi:protein gp37